MKTFYIKPAMTDQAGQCNIYAKEHFAPIKDVRKDYEANWQDWHNVGIMNSRGHLVCLQSTQAQMDDIKACEPLSAGLIFEYPA